MEYLSKDQFKELFNEALRVERTEFLLQMLPTEISTGEGYQSLFELKIRVYGDHIYQIAYGNCASGSGEWHDMVNSGETKTLSEAAHHMLMWLLDNDFIKTKEIC